MNKTSEPLPLLHFVTRIFHKKAPDTILQFPLPPVEENEKIIASLGDIEESVDFQNQISILACSKFKKSTSAQAMYTKLDRSSVLMKVLSRLFWESAHYYFPIVDEYDRVTLKGNYDVVTTNSSVYIGNDGLENGHPMRTFYPTLGRILSNEVVFESNVQPLGFNGMVVGHVSNEITCQIHFFQIKMTSCFHRTMGFSEDPTTLNETLANCPESKKVRYSATFQHAREQLLLLKRLLQFALELENLNVEEVKKFTSKNDGEGVLMIDDRLNIICVSLNDIQKKRRAA